MRQLPALLLLALTLSACAHRDRKSPQPDLPMDKAIEAAQAAVIEKGEQAALTAQSAHYFPQPDGKGWKILVRFAPTFGRDGGYAIVTVDGKGKVTSYKTGG